MKIVIYRIIMVALSIAIDSSYYGKMTWSAYNFLKFNLVDGGSAYYGISATFQHFLFIPLLFLGWVIFLPIGLYSLHSKSRLKYFKVFSVSRVETFLVFGFHMLIIALSVHKEDRFLLPIFPILILWIALGVEALGESKVKLDEQKIEKRSRFTKPLIFLAISTNLVILVLVSLVKEVGAFKVLISMTQGDFSTLITTGFKERLTVPAMSLYPLLFLLTSRY
jgi:hypothetical protein